jgi:hypothetical protein
MKSFRTITAVLATSALAGGLAAPVLAQSADYPTDTSATTEAHQGGKKGRHGPRKLSDAQLTTVATKLGTTLEALKAAQAAVKTATEATEARETHAQRDALLADELNVTVAQLRAAFASVRGATDGRCKGGAGAAGTTAGTYPTDTSTTAAAA